MKRCPFCAEEIQDEATVCKHCGSNLTAPQPMAPQPMAPQPMAPVDLRVNLLTAIQRYVAYGYTIVSQLESMAVLERRAPVNAVMMIAAFLLFWPAAIFYAIPGIRKKYSVQLMVDSSGQVMESGGTIAEYEKDRQRTKTWGWVLLGIAIVLFICAVIAASADL